MLEWFARADLMNIRIVFTNCQGEKGEPRGGFQRLRFEIPLAGGGGCLRRRGGNHPAPASAPGGGMRKWGMLCPGRLAVALEAHSLKAGETKFFKGTDGLAEFREARFDPAVHDIAGAACVQMVGDLIKI
jgi:hypothetical protein